MVEPGSPPSRGWRSRVPRRANRSSGESRAVEPVPGGVGEWHRHLELADLPPAVTDKVAFEEAAPRRVRNDKVPAEAQEIFRDVWNDIVADVYDEMAGRGRKQLFDKDVINRVLQRVAIRMQRAERSLICLLYTSPSPRD